MRKHFLRSISRYRYGGWRTAAFTTKVTRRLRARSLTSQYLPYRPGRQIALEIRRRESEQLTYGQSSRIENLRSTRETAGRG